MQLLHTCPVPNADFASLSLLLIDSASDKNASEGNPKENKKSNDNSDGDEEPSSKNITADEGYNFVNLTMVYSPLATTSPTVIHQSLCELHESLSSSFHSKTSLKSNHLVMNQHRNGRKYGSTSMVLTRNKEEEGPAADETLRQKIEEGESIKEEALEFLSKRSVTMQKYDEINGISPVQGPEKTLEFQKSCMMEESDANSIDIDGVSSFDNRPYSFRPSKHRNGILLNCITISDEIAVQQCASIFGSASLGQANNSIRESSSSSQRGVLVISVGITGMPYSYGISSITSSLTAKFLEFRRIVCNPNLPSQLQQFSTERINSKLTIDNNMSKEAIDLILTSMIIEEELFRTNEITDLERNYGGVTIFGIQHQQHQLQHGDSDSAVATTPTAERRSKFVSGIKLSKKKFGFSSSRNRQKREQRGMYHDDDNDETNITNRNLISTAVVSSSAPSSDVARIITEQMQVLSLVEKEMKIQPYQKRQKLLAEYTNQSTSRKSASSSKTKSPMRRSKASKLDVGMSGSDLVGFDYTPRHHVADDSHSSSNGSTAASSISGAASIGGDTASTTAFSSVDSVSSSASIPTLSGPIRDSSLSKRQIRRNKVLAASARNRNQFSISWRGDGTTISTDDQRKLINKNELELKVGYGNDDYEQAQRANFDPFAATFEENSIRSGDPNWKDTSINDTSEFTAFGQNFSSPSRTVNSEKSGNSFSHQEYDGSVVSPETVTAQNIPTSIVEFDCDNASDAHDMKASEYRKGRIKQIGATNPAPTSTDVLLINVALNEDLACSYRQSKLVSCQLEGMIQVQIKSRSSVLAPFALTLRDLDNHIGKIVENNKHAADISHTLTSVQNDGDVTYKYSIDLPKANHYFPVVKYKCHKDLRPVPLRVESKVRVNECNCRVALQVRSNPANEQDLSDLTIVMAVPPNVIGETLSTQPTGGVWNEEKRSVIWIVAELGAGQKFQLQAQFTLNEELVDDKVMPAFPVLIRCQSMYSQLSTVKVNVCKHESDTEIRMKVARRFRLSHKEKH